MATLTVADNQSVAEMAPAVSEYSPEEQRAYAVAFFGNRGPLCEIVFQNLTPLLYNLAMVLEPYKPYRYRDLIVQRGPIVNECFPMTVWPVACAREC